MRQRSRSFYERVQAEDVEYVAEAFPAAVTFETTPGNWANPTNAFSDTDSDAVASITATAAQQIRASVPALADLPADAVITKVEVLARWRVASNSPSNPRPGLSFRINAASVNGTFVEDSSEPLAFSVFTADVTAQRAFSRADMDSFQAVFRARDTTATGTLLEVDWVKVRVTYLSDELEGATTTYDLEVEVDGDGQVFGPGIDAPVDPATILTERERAPLRALAATGSRFVGWSGDAEGASQEVSVDMLGDRAVTATFEPLSGGVESEIPGSGAILRQDRCEVANPVTGLWGALQSAYPEQNETNDQYEYHPTGGDTHELAEGGVEEGYRRLFLTDGLQSIYDANTGNTSYRTQLVSNSRYTGYFVYPPDSKRVTYLSVRLDDPSPLPDEGEIAGWSDSQVFQMKQVGSLPEPGGKGLPPIIAMTETGDKLLLSNNVRRTPTTLAEILAPKGVWLRFAIDVRYHWDPEIGGIQVWGDIDESGLLFPLTDVIRCQTCYEPETGNAAYGTLSFGPYQKMSIPAVGRDYAGLQLCESSSPV